MTNPAGTLQIDTTAPTVSSVVTSGTGIDGSGNGDLECRPCGHADGQYERGGDGCRQRHADAVAEQLVAPRATSAARGSNALTFSYTVAAGQNTGRPGGDVVQPQRGHAEDAAGNAPPVPAR